jgi:hypothetical protein
VLWEKSIGPGDAAGLYNAACTPAVTAAAIRSTDETGAAAKEADAEADRAMAWLKQAVAAGFNDAAHMRQDMDIDSLRVRDDFQLLLRDLEAKNAKR